MTPTKNSIRKSGVKIYLAKHCGFCFGVKRAIKIAKEAGVKYKNVYIKGELVHNEGVCEDIEKSGIKRADFLNKLPPRSNVIIKAHGEPLETYEKLKAMDLNIVDATCPMVKDIHKKARELEEKGYQVVIVGDRNHEETKGILGNIKNGIILENKDEAVRFQEDIKNKIGVICQSTQTLENVVEVINRLARHAEELLFINTICNPTRLRQREIEELSMRCKAVLVVGSKKSANTKRLYEAAKKINKNSFWITSQYINKNNFRRFTSIGIIGGASTPVEVLETIAGRLNETYDFSSHRRRKIM
ncbi:MAG: 4-hydroxy-3-methylbut-2-enyl diphosphate reductase [Candidatus Omnitrophica bacterium]|nr:4-hydroxy-3-methylbut-2-enyl diphosphate reductase [Candidatus Omnitrophota bacterium]